MKHITYLLCLLALPLAAFDIQDELHQEFRAYPKYVPNEVWSMIKPYLIPKNHPLKAKLDSIFSKRRVLEDANSLARAGFINREPPSHSKAIVIRHRDIKGYIFKIYLDSKKVYFRNQPEYISWMLRARGAKLVRKEVEKQGWQDYFKVPRKWIYPLPNKPKAKKGSLQKNFILVEDEMDLLPLNVIHNKWRDGTITTKHLDMLFHIVNVTGLRGGCKFDNIPICKDGRLAFIDTESNLKWPLYYDRLYQVLEGDLKAHWDALIESVKDEEFNQPQ